ncbi:acylamino-acid-releasing enzyme-like isoform X2 [Galleria mellonella]|uniref:acylaminoacyl-peptidase n=1 Tax=Galleria mellonella TaxID=7137 RepID=A0ABM3N761_GALME|nr:acylamino-acid-releasing enzyme-like isoform X2 [Galleria mellonella]
MTSQLENIINVYKRLAKIPSIVGGRLNSSGNKVLSKWSVRNLDKGKTSKYLLDYVLNSDLKVISESSFGTDVSNELLSSVSPRDTYRAVIREEKEKDKKQYLEVWSKTSLVHCIDLTALDLHGDVYADSEFGCLNWSQDESAIVYVAERKLPKYEPYIKRKNEEKLKTEGSGESTPKKGEEFVYRQDWGEQLVGKHLSSIVVCQLQTEKFTVLEGLPESWCPGQVSFTPDGKSVVGVAWETEPRRLGLMFCTNRPGYIFSLTLDGKLSKLSKEGVSVRSPRVFADGVVWLQRTPGGPHHACHSLVIRRNGSEEVCPIIDIVDTELKITDGASFHGLYCQSLPHACFTGDGRVVFSTPHTDEIRSYIADIDGKRIVDISNKSFSGSTSILDMKGGVILAACSNMTTPGQLYVGRLPAAGSEAQISWRAVGPSPQSPLPPSTVQYLQLRHEHCTDTVNSFTAIYLAPEGNKKLPLVVWPHGGPHTNFVNAFAIETALFNLLGLASIRINFRGSIGHGDKHVRSLIGHVGEYDVQDCLLALTTVKERDSRLDHCLLYSGSYGGFTIAHLAGQYPDRFVAMVMRNPVLDFATKGPYADNSDGCAVEAGFEFKESGPLSEQEFLAMRRCSPLAHVHRVKAPTAIMLGSGDKRVPHFQGLDYARRLKANGVPTRIYMYDDNHSLSSLPSEMDNLINGVHWFLQHLPS